MGRYHGPMVPAPWVERHAPLIPPGGTVLDVACGSGRHARFFLEREHPVVAVDIDTSGVADLRNKPGVEIVEADLERDDGWPFAGRTFAGIVVANYLWRPLFPALAAALAPGGALLYQTFMAGNEQFGRPRNPDHLLKPGELRAAFAEILTVAAYEEVLALRPKPAAIQRIAAIFVKS